jgi:catechol 2,3-dioxygenase-like lactoylglutathione lyase family enzyme
VLVGELVAFVASRDLAISDRFYGGLLGLKLVESSAFANVYDVGGTTLRVTRVDEPPGARHTVLGWRVSDIAASIETLRSAGVSVERYERLAQDEHGVWSAPGGSRVAWFTDPDGNVVSLQQPPAGGAAQTASTE